MAKVPHGRSLVKKYEGKPFALLGVNLDRSVADLQKVQKNQGIPWRSWFDQGGRIATAWGVQFLPTVIVIDQKGVIRYTDVRDAQMEEAINKLLAE